MMPCHSERSARFARNDKVLGHRLHALDPKSSWSYVLRQFGCEVLHSGDRLLALVTPHTSKPAHEKNRFAHAGAAIRASSASHSATPARSPMACRMPRLC